MADQIVEILRSFQAKLFLNTPDLPESLRVFVTSFHDWISCLTQGDYLWNGYGFSLTDDIACHIKDAPEEIQSWITYSTHHPTTVSGVLSRQYAARHILSCSIDVHHTAPEIYSLWSLMMFKTIAFQYLDPDPWDLDLKGHSSIGLFRDRQKAMQESLETITQEDFVDDDVARPDGQVSSLLLIYGLHRVQMILSFEHVVHEHPSVGNIVDDLYNTLTQLKGAICHGENRWSSADVR